MSMTLKEAKEILKDLIDASPCAEIEITIEDKQTLQFFLSLADKIEVEKMQDVFVKMGCSVIRAKQYAEATYIYLTQGEK